MSVPARDRRIASNTFMQKAKDLEIFTIRSVMNEKIIPKRSRLLIGQHIINLSMDTYTNVRRANAVYVKDAESFNMRHMYQQNAYTTSSALIAQIDVLPDLFPNIKSSVIGNWSKLAIETTKYIGAWIQSDYEKFNKQLNN